MVSQCASRRCSRLRPTQREAAKHRPSHAARLAPTNADSEPMAKAGGEADSAAEAAITSAKRKGSRPITSPQGTPGADPGKPRGHRIPAAWRSGPRRDAGTMPARKGDLRETL